MRSAPNTQSPMSDVVLVIGVALFAGALAMMASGLRGIDDRAASAGAAPSAHRTIERHPRSQPSLPVHGAPGVHDLTRDADALRLGRNPRSPEASGHEAAGIDLGDANMARAAARWSSEWHGLAMEGDDARGYLSRTSNVRRIGRRLQNIAAWDNGSGYGALEANRAARSQTRSDPARGTTDRRRDSAPRHHHTTGIRAGRRTGRPGGRIASIRRRTES